MKFFVILLMSMLFFTACEDQEQAANGANFTEHTFDLQDTKGNSYVVKKMGQKVTVVGHEDKVVIFDIFATWCPGCKVIAPHLGNLQKKYPNKLLVLGITIERNISNEKLDAFSKDHGANYPISNSEENNILAQRLAYDMRQPRSFPIPLIIMYDPKGNYFRHYIGPAAEEIIDRDIQSAQGKK